MTITFGVIMDPIETIQFGHDSTLALYLAAQKRHWVLYYLKQSDLFWQDGSAFATAKRIKVFDDPNIWFSVLEETVIPLDALNIIFMRKDPPFDLNYLITTWLLDHAVAAGSLVMNHPQGLRDANEKCFITHFPACIPPTLISAQYDLLTAFHQRHGKVVFKPLDRMGGQGIFLATENDNIQAKLMHLSENGTKAIMAQRYIPAIREGDKRIFLIDGQVLPYALARIPPAGKLLANLAAGGHAKGVKINARDRWISEQIGPTLKKKGLLFVGIDVIGDYLTEINVTSPTGILEIERAFDVNICEKVLNVAIEQYKIR